MIEKIEEIENKFKTIKNVGGDGESLAKLTIRTINNIKIIINEFERGMKSPTWSTNMNNTLTPKEQKYMMDTYTLLKNTLASLNEIKG